MRGWLAVAVVVALSGCLTSATKNLDDNPGTALSVGMPDPAAVGSFPVERIDFDLGYMTVTEPRTMVVPFPSHLIGSVHYPTTGDGPFPLILFMHGRHSTCGARGVGETLGPVVCPETPLTYPVDSYTGYDYIAEQLASHGYVVLSVSANNVNDLDQQYGDRGATSRAQLIVRYLDDFQRFNQSAAPEPIGGRLIGKMDLSRIGLMGHSRGGEGVTRAITYNRDRTDGPPHDIKAVFALAPTDFSRWPAPDVAFATLLPYCDGDVSNLHGAWIYDDARFLDERTPSPKVQILAFGSNHNFYNTVWTGNDAGSYRNDPHCSSEEAQQKGTFVFLGPEDQRRHGLVYMSSFFRAYVGDEQAFVPLFTGRERIPESACPAASPNCDGMIHISYQAPEGNRLVLERTSDESTFQRNDLGGPNKFEGFTNRSICVPHACPTQPNYAAATQLVLGWDAPGSVATFAFPTQDVDPFTHLTFRVGVAGGDPRNDPDVAKDFRVELRDEKGNVGSVNAADFTHALFEPPGTPEQKTTLNMVAIPLDAFQGIEPTDVVEVRFVFDASPKGLVQFADLQFQVLP